MTFRWPGLPSPRAAAHEIADLAELNCWRKAGTSMQEISRLLGRLEENNYAAGVPELDRLDDRVQEAFVELEHRLLACRDGYPFRLARQGTTLVLKREWLNSRQTIYRYLLLATRLNMKSNRCHAGIDGTALLESLSAEVAREYFGGRAESLVFGTAAGGYNFRQRVDYLCSRIGEGGGFRYSRTNPTRARDGKLDIVAWTPFTDNLPGKLIGFGQCKTGTSYEDDLPKLRPETFRDKWLNSSLVVLPIRMFFISEALSSDIERRSDISSEAGLTFDRCRIVDFCTNVNPELLSEVRRWTSAAAEATELPANW